MLAFATESVKLSRYFEIIFSSSAAPRTGKVPRRKGRKIKGKFL